MRQRRRVVEVLAHRGSRRRAAGRAGSTSARSATMRAGLLGILCSASAWSAQAVPAPDVHLAQPGIAERRTDVLRCLAGMHCPRNVPGHQRHHQAELRNGPCRPDIARPNARSARPGAGSRRAGPWSRRARPANAPTPRATRPRPSRRPRPRPRPRIARPATTESGAARPPRTRIAFCRKRTHRRCRAAPRWPAICQPTALRVCQHAADEAQPGDAAEGLGHDHPAH